MILSFLASCKTSEMNFEISYQKTLDDFPSSSGMVYLKNNYYAVGDDSPFLFKLDNKFEIITKNAIFDFSDSLKKGRIPKKIKPDFEALERISENEIIAFGSGSKSPERDVFLKLTIKNKKVSVESYNITLFYNYLSKLNCLKNSELNIEGLTFVNNTLYLFNRGKNIVFSVAYKDFFNFLNKQLLSPNVEFIEFNLPKINGIESGFSGATISNNKQTILVTSSVEATKNAYNDGEVLGSFIGIIPLEKGKIQKSAKWTKINSEKPLKVESITINKEISENEFKISLAVDNDDGKSSFLKGKINF